MMMVEQLRWGLIPDLRDGEDVKGKYLEAGDMELFLR